MKKKLWRMLINLLLSPVFPGLAIPDGDPPASEVVDPLEKLELTIRNMADNIEGMEGRLKTEYGTDLQAIQDEQDEKRTAHETKMEALLQEARAPIAVGLQEPEDFCGYGKDGVGDFIAEAYAATRVGGTQPSERLVKLQARQMERRDLSTLAGEDGAYLVPDQWSSTILRVPDDGQFLRRYCQEIPAGTQPNAAIKMPYLDQGGEKGVYGGVIVLSAVEAENLSALTTPKVGLITLKPEKAGAYYILTEELRANAPAMAALIPTLLQGGISSYVDDKIQDGTGAGEMLKFGGCSAEISVAREVANALNYMDVVNMLARVLTRGRYVFLCQRVGMLPQLMTMVDGSGKLIWADNARDGIPSPSLAGVPIFFNEISPALGTAGDLRLVDLSYYLIKNGMGASMKSDQTFSNWLSGKETLKTSFYIDGKPWLKDPMKLRDGTNTVSPFISLAA